MNDTLPGRRSSLLHKPAAIIDRIASIPVLVSLLLLTAFFPAVLFPAAGIGDELPLDLYFSYSPDQVYAYLGRLGAGGRSAYAGMELTSDLLFPVVYALALSVAMTIAARKILPPASRLRSLRLLPVLIVIADWSENLGLSMVLHAYPDRLDGVVALASFSTSLKWSILVLVACLLLTAGTLAVTRHLWNWPGWWKG